MASNLSYPTHPPISQVSHFKNHNKLTTVQKLALHLVIAINQQLSKTS